MTDETLTAGERALLFNYETHKRDVALKLLRLYDAALARAEAAERLVSPDVRKHWDSVYGRMNTAESRLAEATELLHKADDTFGWQCKVDAFLCATVPSEKPVERSEVTPAQAAEPLPPEVLADALQDRIAAASGRLLSSSPVFAAQAAEPAPNPEEPACHSCGRLLAVCECGPLVALFGAVPDMPCGELESTRADLATARARIAELERTVRFACSEHDKANTECESLQTRIDQAVTELENHVLEGDIEYAVKSALALLRGGQ